MLTRRTIRGPSTACFQIAVRTVLPSHATSRGFPTLSATRRPLMHGTMAEMFLGTTNGVLSLNDGKLEPLGLEGMSVTALHAGDGALLAGTYGDGLWRRGDGDWERVDEGLSASTF